MRDENIVYLGCDPGKDGYITAYDGKDFKFYSMPKKKVETGEFTKSNKPKIKTVFDDAGFRELTLQINRDFDKATFIVTLEDVTGRQGWSAQNNFNFGHTAGLQKMIFIMLGADITMVKPQKWQSFMGQGYAKIKVPSSTGKTMVNDTKAFAEMIATTEYPNIDFRHSARAKNNHDGKIDSFLLCLYGFRRHRQQQ